MESQANDLNPAKVGCGVIALVVVVMFARWLMNPFGEPNIVESDRPFSVAEVEEHSGLELPESASNIRYARFSQWIALDVRLRFEAPLADCIAFAERVVKSHNEHHKDGATWGVTKFSGPMREEVGRCGELKTDWFDVQNIKHGLEA